MTSTAGSAPLVVLAGGGTGGHIFPNVAIAERIAKAMPALDLHFWVSDRPGDAKLMSSLPYAWTASPTHPLPPLSRPFRAVSFTRRWFAASSQFRTLLRSRRVLALVTTGGFVSGPPMMIARKEGLVRAMVNLDGVPGKANRRLKAYAQQCFTVYPHPLLPEAQTIGLPIRSRSIAPGDAAHCRSLLGLDPQKSTLFITGATHGATSIVETMMQLVQAAPHAQALANWQVFHQCGTYDTATLKAAYQQAGVSAKVVDYCQTMGAAWGASDIAISRSGAGSVAEAWKNAVPTIFMPNPYHADGHQRDNCAPMIKVNAAIEVRDAKDPQDNAPRLAKVLVPLLTSPQAREQMRRASQDSCPGDGAQQVADWLVVQLQTQMAAAS